MRMNEFFDYTKKMKKVDSEDLYAICHDAQELIIDYCVKKAHNHKFEKQTSELFSRMANKKFIKTMKKLAKNDELDPGFAFAGDCFVNYILGDKERDQEDLEEIVLGYSEIREILLKPQVKEIYKKTGIDKAAIIELLSVVPDKKYMRNEKYVRIYLIKIMKKLYMMAKDVDDIIINSSQIDKLFKAIFGKEFLDVISIYILLERKPVIADFNESQIKIFNKFSVFALETIEKQEKKHIKELIKLYIDTRSRDAENNRDSARRLNLMGCTADSYPKIAKVVEKLKDKNDNAKYL